MNLYLYGVMNKGNVTGGLELLSKVTVNKNFLLRGLQIQVPASRSKIQVAFSVIDFI
jgi:hypothetical protein